MKLPTAEAGVPTMLVGRQSESGKQTLEMIVGYCAVYARQKTNVDLLNGTPHAEVGVNVDFQVTHRH